jgi:pimeloyl-ACP methyl ester carboxylesterase
VKEWEERDAVAGIPLFWREAPAPARRPTIYLHGVPTDGDDWLQFLARTGGVAPDLPGFGRSGKPADFDYSIEGYERFLQAFVEHLRLERFSLVVHDWGAVGLALAQRMPERVERLVIVNSVPFLLGYRWHRIARMWRRRVVGELLMGTSSRWAFKQLSREATAAPGPLPDAFIDRIWKHFDHGTQRAILRLYRSAPEDALARAGERLAEIRARALVLWGTHDPYLPTSFAEAYADALGGPARVELVEDAGHWPWIDRPEVVETVAEFLDTTP